MCRELEVLDASSGFAKSCGTVAVLERGSVHAPRSVGRASGETMIKFVEIDVLRYTYPSKNLFLGVVFLRISGAITG